MTGGIKGMDDVIKNLKNWQQKIQQLQGTHKVSVKELFSAGFMKRHTKFASFDAMVTASSFKVENEEDFKKIPDAEWDAYVRSSTKFANWQEMINKAGEEWLAAKVKV